MRRKKYTYKFISNLVLSSDLPCPKPPTQALSGLVTQSSSRTRGEKDLGVRFDQSHITWTRPYT